MSRYPLSSAKPRSSFTELSTKRAQHSRFRGNWTSEASRQACKSTKTIKKEESICFSGSQLLRRLRLCPRFAIDQAFAGALLDLTRCSLKCSFVPDSSSILVVYGLKVCLWNWKDIVRDKFFVLTIRSVWLAMQAKIILRFENPVFLTFYASTESFASFL